MYTQRKFHEALSCMRRVIIPSTKKYHALLQRLRELDLGFLTCVSSVAVIRSVVLHTRAYFAGLPADACVLFVTENLGGAMAGRGAPKSAEWLMWFVRRLWLKSGRSIECFIIVDLATMHTHPDHLVQALARVGSNQLVYTAMANDVGYAGQQQPSEILAFAIAIKDAYETLGWAPSKTSVHLILGYAMQEALKKLDAVHAALPAGFELSVSHTPLAGVPGSALSQQKCPDTLSEEVAAQLNIEPPYKAALVAELLRNCGGVAEG